MKEISGVINRRDKTIKRLKRRKIRFKKNYKTNNDKKNNDKTKNYKTNNDKTQKIDLVVASPARCEAGVRSLRSRRAVIVLLERQTF